VPCRGFLNREALTKAQKKTWLIITGLGVAGAAYWAWQVSKAAKQVDFQISAIGKPGIKSGEFGAPVQITFANPSDVALPIDNLQVDVLLQQQGNLWLKVGEIIPTGPFTIAPGQSSQVIYPKINFKAFGRNVLEAVNQIANAKPTLKVVANVKAMGIHVPPQEKIFSL
jgi:hypothetical protein